jgi:hypothetical protein
MDVEQDVPSGQLCNSGEGKKTYGGLSMERLQIAN